VTGAATVGTTLGVTGATTLSSTLAVTSTSTLTGDVTMSGAATVGTTLGVTGATTLSSTLGVSGATTLASVSVTGAATVGDTLTVTGALSKGSGSFMIDHPLPELKDSYNLFHSFIEGPRADLIYRGQVRLTSGRAVVDLDAVSRMTSGTFVALNRDVQCFTSNESDWDAVRGTVTGATLTIECQNSTSTAVVNWLVIGERHDQHMYDTHWTDENGRVVPEQLKKSATT